MDESPQPIAENGTEAPEAPDTGPAPTEPAGAGPANGGLPDTEAADLWEEALGRLQHVMKADTFAHLLRDSHLVEATDDTWRIAVQPRAIAWLAGRDNALVRRTVSIVTGRDVSLEYVAQERPPATPSPPRAPRPADSPAAPDPPTRDQKPARPSALESLLSFDPNSASGGGFWKMGHYANWFWAAFLGTVAWRVYELVVSGDKRPRKTLWTPPRRFSISELARAVASGRGGRPNRDQIRGRYRRVNGQRVWQPGAFDLLTRESVARIEWHAGDVHWRPWKPGGSCRPGRSGIRIVYRISVVTSLPLLTPRQVAQLPAQNQVEHERYLANRAQDLVAWEQITLPTLAGLDQGAQNPAGQTQLPPGRQ